MPNVPGVISIRCRTILAHVLRCIIILILAVSTASAAR
jgi:hypothetical protein